MTAVDIQKLTQTFALYAAYYRAKFEDEILRMYAEDLSDLDYPAVNRALETYRRDPRNKTMPMPSQIREKLTPQVDHESVAREIAARIGGAITKFGWASSDRAREYIGEIGWRIVETRGGWTNLCQNHGVTIDPTAFEAQVREQAKAAVKYGDQALGQAIGIAGGGRRGEIQSIGEIIRSLPGKEDEK